MRMSALNRCACPFTWLARLGLAPGDVYTHTLHGFDSTLIEKVGGDQECHTYKVADVVSRPRTRLRCLLKGGGPFATTRPTSGLIVLEGGSFFAYCVCNECWPREQPRVARNVCRPTRHHGGGDARIMPTEG
jgi:hypothetical protein